MILVRKIEIIEFRGIRKLEIDFKKKNFAICGKNGTGKSGIVDAIEFGLTGDVSRLAGSGTGGISLKEHAPHVDCRSDPNKSSVIITIYIPSLKKEATIERSVGDVQKPIITPASPEILEILSQVSSHPEFTLSRRELIKYVISSPGDRSQKVQALLRLEKVENLRTVLQKIANADKKEITPLKAQKDNAKNHLLSALGIQTPELELILEAVNIRRLQLGLPALAKYTDETSFREGLSELASAKPVTISRPAAILSLEDLSVQIKSYGNFGKAEDTKKVVNNVQTLSADKASITLLKREGFLKTALDNIDDGSCPVCDTELGIQELKEILEKKLKNFDKISAKRAQLETEFEPFISTIRNLIAAIRRVKEYGSQFKPAIDTQAFDNFINELQDVLNKLVAFLPIDELILALGVFGKVPEEVNQLLETFNTAILAIPEPTKQDAAREFLIIAQEKLEHYRHASTQHKSAVSKEAMSASVSKTYNQVATSTLENLYNDVQVNFSELYRSINEDDESTFTAQLTPSAGKLGFNVDFYGRGYFPPGAYHSEGHQDGMGLCLYLALMKHILGENFTFAVLDDVLMSVDSGHRREVCKMLREKFPNTQFILTTHDEVWLKHMKTAGLIQGSNAIQFRKWDVENGPNDWNEKDVWSEIEEYLDKNDVRAAAALLRHYLEYLSSDICHKLKARVEFSGDAHYSLGDLLIPATTQMTKLLDEGIAAANSWGKPQVVEQLQEQKKAFKQLITTSNLEQWQANVAIHYNEWANLDKKDFLPVVEAFKNLMKGFCCTDENCKSLVYVIKRDTLRCSCGSVNINLNPK